MPLAQRAGRGRAAHAVRCWTSCRTSCWGCCCLLTVRRSEHCAADRLRRRPGPLCVLAAAWMLWMFTLHPAWRVPPAGDGGVLHRADRDHGAPGASGSPGSGSSRFTSYFYVFAVLRLAVAAARRGRGGRAGRHLAGLRREQGHRSAACSSTSIIVAVNVASRCASHLVRHRSRQAERPARQALDELSEANRRLEATLAENAGLHAAAAGPGPGGRDPGRAAADGPGDPRHPGPGTDRDHHPAAGGRAGQPTTRPGGAGTSTAATRLARESLSEARRSVDALRPEPLETGRLSEALADVAAPLVGPARDPGPGHDDRHGPADAARRPSSRCCAPRRRRWPTWPSTRRRPGSG